MKKHLLCFLVTILYFQSFATKMVEVKVVDKDYILVYFKDGIVTFPDDGTGICAFQQFCDQPANTKVSYGTALNTTNAVATANWTIKSTDDASFGTSGVHPSNCYRKTKLNGLAQGAWVSTDYAYDYTLEHTIYLKLPQSMQQGKTYTIEINANTNTDATTQTFTFDIFNSKTEAIHVNLNGYADSKRIKASDLYIWLGDGGARDYSSFVGNKVYLYNVNTKVSQQVNTLSLWKTKAAEAQSYYLIQSDVWNADFTGFNQAGTYRLAIDGVGCSED
jgi:endoglucanase